MRFAAFCSVVVLAFAALEWRGVATPARERAQIPASVRSSPGGYRSYHFWHTGFHGGK